MDALFTWKRIDVVVDSKGEYRAFGFRDDGAAFYADGAIRELAIYGLNKFLNVPYDRTSAVSTLLREDACPE